MNYRKIIYSLSFTAFGIILVSAFWGNPFILSALLVIATFIKHKTIPIKKEVLWFVITGIIGAFGESIIMTFGPWTYARSDIINFPIWLLFLWGYAGTLGISLYRGITEKS